MECNVTDPTTIHCSNEAAVGIGFQIRDVVSLRSCEIGKCCRLCALPADGGVCIFGVEGMAMNLAAKINATLPIQVSESMELPLQVCRRCIENLNSTVNFIEGVKEAQKKIKVLQGFPGAQQCNPRAGIEVNPSVHQLTEHRISKHLNGVGSLDYGGRKDTAEIIKVVNCGAAEPSALRNGPPFNAEHVELNNSEHESSNDADDCSYSDKETYTLYDERPIKNQLAQSPTLPCPSFLPNKITREGSTCKYCNASFKLKPDLLSHEIMAHSDSVFHCQVCFKVFYDDKAKDHRKTHPQFGATMSSNKADRIPVGDENHVIGISRNGNIRTENKEKSSSCAYGCKYCSFKGTTLEGLFNHQTASHPQFVFRCKVCLKVFYENVLEFRQHEGEHIALSKMKESHKNPPQIHLNKKTMYAHLTEKQREWLETLLRPKAVESGPCTSAPVGKDKPNDVPSVLVTLGEARLTSCNLCQLHFNSIRERDIHCDFHHKIRLPCRFCPRTFRQRAGLLEHERSHKDKHVCRKCGLTFENEDDYHKHKAFNHVVLPRYSCEICKRLYVREAQLSKHMVKEHLNARPFVCENCGVSFESRSNLQSHAITHQKNQETLKMYDCRLCGKTFKDRGNLNDHVLSHGVKSSSNSVRLRENSAKHPSHPAKFTCPLCGMIFTLRLNMLSHLKRHDEIRCLVCREQFADIQLLLNHQKATHPDEGLAEFSSLEGQGSISITDAQKCGECSKYFASKLSLRVHQRERHILVGEPFWCDLCHKKYKEKSALMDHVATQHFGKTLFQCGHCPCVFLCPKNKVQHEQDHAKKNMLNTCHECGESFQTATEFSKHSVTVHPLANKGSFQCDRCPKTFSCETFLAAHQQSHDIKRRYSCSICCRSFSNLKNKTCHEKTHLQVQNRNLEANGLSEDVRAASLISRNRFHSGGEGFEKVEQEVVYNSGGIVNCGYSEVIFVSDKLV